MNKNYEKEFHEEIERIIKLIHTHNQDTESKDKRTMVKTEEKYVLSLELFNIAKRTNPPNGKTYPLVFLQSGYEVFEKYNGWFDYKKKVIYKKEKIENAKGLAQRFWWLPVIISVLAIIVSVIALFTNN